MGKGWNYRENGEEGSQQKSPLSVTPRGLKMKRPGNGQSINYHDTFKGGVDRLAKDFEMVAEEEQI